MKKDPEKSNENVNHSHVETSHSLSDQQVFGENTHYIAVRGNENDTREWLRKWPVCPVLEHHHIAHVGVINARAPFNIVRKEQSGTFMLCCTEGEGRVLSEGQWRVVKKGQACLLPPFVQNAFGCISEKNWEFAYVRYQESRERNPIISANSPVIGHYDPFPLKHAIRGLHAETVGLKNPAATKLWVELIHGYVVRFSQPHQADSRLWKLWQTVEKDVGHRWSLAELANQVSVSGEHLRRLSHRELGRSPMQHVTFLRMQRAAHLLATTDAKIETVCREVGFQSLFTFSNAFKKWVGRRPSEHRGSKV